MRSFPTLNFFFFPQQGIQTFENYIYFFCLSFATLHLKLFLFCSHIIHCQRVQRAASQADDISVKPGQSHHNWDHYSVWHL